MDQVDEMNQNFKCESGLKYTTFAKSSISISISITKATVGKGDEKDEKKKREIKEGDYLKCEQCLLEC